ncbi:MAG: hypothetical protein ABIF01_04520 [Candidatus Micrarchaeota archaeon]
MPTFARADNSAISTAFNSLIERMEIGKNRVPEAPQIVHSYTDSFRAGIKEQINDLTKKACGSLQSRVNDALQIDGKTIFYEPNPDHPPVLGEPKKGTPIGTYKNMLTDVYSGIDPQGKVATWTSRSTIPKDATVLFVSRKSNDWRIEALQDPNLSTQFFQSLAQMDKICSLSEAAAVNASAILSESSPKKGFYFEGSDQETKDLQDRIKSLSEGKILGSLPAIFVNYANGESLPMELYVSKSDEQEFRIVDPITGIHTSGKTLSEALNKLCQSGYYPPGAIFCQSATNGFTSSFEKAGVITSSTVVKSWESTGDSVAGALGWFSLGCMAAAPESGGTTAVVGAATGIPAMGWFSFRAVQHFIKQYKYEDKAFDPTSPEDWREAGILLASVFTRGKGAAVARFAGIGMMATADIWQFCEDISKFKSDEQKMSGFLLKRSGELAASLALNIYFGKKEFGSMKTKSTPRIEEPTAKAADFSTVPKKTTRVVLQEAEISKFSQNLGRTEKNMLTSDMSLMSGFAKTKDLLIDAQPDLVLFPLTGAWPIARSIRLMASVERQSSQLPQFSYPPFSSHIYSSRTLKKGAAVFEGKREILGDYMEDFVRKPLAEKGVEKPKIVIIDEVKSGSSLRGHYQNVNAYMKKTYGKGNYEIEFIGICDKNSIKLKPRAGETKSDLVIRLVKEGKMEFTDQSLNSKIRAGEISGTELSELPDFKYLRYEFKEESFQALIRGGDVFFGNEEFSRLVAEGEIKTIMVDNLFTVDADYAYSLSRVQNPDGSVRPAYSGDSYDPELSWSQQNLYQRMERLYEGDLEGWGRSANELIELQASKREKPKAEIKAEKEPEPAGAIH